VNATPRPLYNCETQPVAIVQEAGRTPEPVWTRTYNLVYHWNCTCKHKHLFCVAPPTRIVPHIHLLHCSHLQKNAFIINAVQDVYMCTHNTMVFKILPKCIKWKCLHLLTILCFVADIYVTSGFFIRNVVLNLKIIKNYNSCIFYYKFVELDYTKVALSGLCPFLGFKLGLWTPTDPPLKVLDSWHSITEAQKLFSKHFMRRCCVLTETGVCLCFILWTNSEALIVLT